MAVQAVTRSEFAASPRATVFTWDTLANGDTGAALALGDYDYLTVAVSGIFGTGGSVTFEGSNDGTNYFALTDQAAAAVTKTAAGISAVAEKPLWVRPNATAGDGTTAIDCVLVARKSAR